MIIDDAVRTNDTSRHRKINLCGFIRWSRTEPSGFYQKQLSLKNTIDKEHRCDMFL